MLPKIKVTSNKEIEYITQREPIKLSRLQDDKCAICDCKCFQREKMEGVAGIEALGKIIYISYSFLLCGYCIKTYFYKK